MDDDYGIVEYFYEHSGHRCGYCKSEASSISCGMWAHRMTAGIYDALLNRGWRRSGEYCYKPMMQKTCCCQYAIKLDVDNFKLSKSQKKILKKVHKFLASGKRSDAGEPDEKGDHCASPAGDSVMDVPDFSHKKSDVQTELKACDLNLTEDAATSGETEEAVASEPMDQQPPGKPVESSEGDTASKPEKTTHVPKKGLGADPNKPKCRKARDIRREKRLRKLSEGGGDLSPGREQALKFAKKPKNEPKSLEEFLFEPLPEDSAHKLECDPKGPYSLGSFHQQYWLDGKLIAVGVLDVLPTCLSSVYLYYDPDYSFLSLGTYASLREIAYTRELRKLCPSIKDYCMGFYIHTCPKMRYKGNYSPSRLLCPETYTWHPIEKCRPLLDVNKYSRFEEDPQKGDENAVRNLDEVFVLFNRTVIPYRRYRRIKGDDDRAEVKEFASLVGRSNLKKLFLYRKS
ncbi:arginyltransferase 1 isoform X4 [Haemaphysalis longicornis]